MPEVEPMSWPCWRQCFLHHTITSLVPSVDFPEYYINLGNTIAKIISKIWLTFSYPSLNIHTSLENGYLHQQYIYNRDVKFSCLLFLCGSQLTYSGITPGTQTTPSRLTEFWVFTLISSIQSKCPTCCAISLASVYFPTYSLLDSDSVTSFCEIYLT